MEQVDNESLTNVFVESKLKDTLWGCEGNKNPWYEKFYFRLIKEFRVLLTNGITKVMVDFKQKKWSNEYNASFYQFDTQIS